jgi:hypothetical protein
MGASPFTSLAREHEGALALFCYRVSYFVLNCVMILSPCSETTAPLSLEVVAINFAVAYSLITLAYRLAANTNVVIALAGYLGRTVVMIASMRLGESGRRSRARNARRTLARLPGVLFTGR